MGTEIRPDQITIVPNNANVRSLIYANNTQTTVTNTVVETTLSTFSLPAGMLGPNDALIVETMGKMLFNTTAFFAYRLKSGTTVLSQPVQQIGTGAAGATVLGTRYESVWTNQNATNAQKGVAAMIAPGGNVGQFWYCFTPISTTVDTTQALTLTLTIQWNIASTLLSYTHEYTAVYYQPATTL